MRELNGFDVWYMKDASDKWKLCFGDGGVHVIRECVIALIDGMNQLVMVSEAFDVDTLETEEHEDITRFGSHPIVYFEDFYMEGG